MNYRKRYLTSGVCTTRRVDGVEQDPSNPAVWHVIESAAPNPHIEIREIKVTLLDDETHTVQGMRDDETPQYLSGIVRRVRNASVTR